MTLMKMPMFCLDLADHRLPADRRDAGAGRGHHHDADRPPFWHQLLQPAGGDPVMYQHLLVLRPPRGLHHDLPAFGIISQIVPAFARKRCSATPRWCTPRPSIAILSFIVWAHHMFTTGMPVTGQLFFMYATMLIAGADRA